MVSAISVRRLTISTAKNPIISRVSSFFKTWNTTPIPAHSRKRFGLRVVNDALRWVNHLSYSFFDMFFVISSAQRRVFRETSLGSSRSDSLVSPPGGITEKKDSMSQGRMAAGVSVFLAAASSFGGLSRGSSDRSSSSMSTSPLASLFDFLASRRIARHLRSFWIRATRVVSCRTWNIMS